MRWSRALSALLLISAASDAGAQEPYYKGKRPTVLINFAAGGPTDIEGRLFAKHLAKHLDGHPTIIVQNMDGAGGVVGATYLGEVAPKDGTYLGYLSGTSWVYVSEPERWRVDFKSYEFVAYQPGTTVHFVRTDVEPGMKEPADIVKAKGLIAGGLSIDTSKDLRLRLGLDMLGVPYQHVNGYRRARRRGSRCNVARDQHVFESPPSHIGPWSIRATGEDTGQAMVWHDEVDTGDPPAPQKQMEGLTIPSFPATLQAGQLARCRPAKCGRPTRRCVRRQLDPRRLIALLPGGAAGGLQRAARRDRAAQQRQGFRRRGGQGHRVRARLSDRARHEQARA